MNLPQEIICYFTNLVDLALEECCGTIAPGRICLLLQQHCRFMGCDRMHNCEAEEILSLVEKFSKQVQKQDSYMMASVDVLGAIKTFVDALDGVGKRKKPMLELFSKQMRLCRRSCSTYCTQCRCTKSMKGCLKHYIIFLCQNRIRRGVDIHIEWMWAHCWGNVVLCL